MIELFIEEDQYRRIALKESGQLIECIYEEREAKVQTGDLFLGVIKKKVKGLQSIFVDIGAHKNAFLYVHDVKTWQDYKEGQSILVEVLKEEEGTKGAKVTEKISLGGKYVVLFPGRGFGYSKKMTKEKFLTEKGNFTPLDGYRVLFREASLSAEKEEILDEIALLEETFQLVFKKAETGLGPKKLHGQGSNVERILRDYFSKIQMIYVSHEKIRDQLQLEFGLPSLIHGEGRSLFDFYGIEEELISLLKRRVPLKDGGNLVLEETEAMVVVDVNSAKHKGHKADESLALSVNLQAVKELARQLRLRNLSGIVVIDFIDLKKSSEKEILEKAVQETFAKDPLFGKSYPLTELNLLQLTRKKKGPSIYHYLEEPCHCGTLKGKRLHFDYLMKLLKNELLKKVDQVELLDYHIVIHEAYQGRLREQPEAFLRNIGAEDKRIYLEFSKIPMDFMVEPLVFKNQIEELEKHLITF